MYTLLHKTAKTVFFYSLSSRSLLLTRTIILKKNHIRWAPVQNLGVIWKELPLTITHHTLKKEIKLLNVSFFPCVTVFFHHLAFASILKMYGICRLAACVRLMCFILKSPDSQCEWACTFTLRGKTNQPLSIKLRVITNTKHSCVIICVHTHRNSFTRSFSTLLWVDRDISNQYASIHQPKYLYLMSNICKHLEVCMCYCCWWWIRFHPSMRVHTHTPEPGKPSIPAPPHSFPSLSSHILQLFCFLLV